MFEQSKPIFGLVKLTPYHEVHTYLHTRENIRGRRYFGVRIFENPCTKMQRTFTPLQEHLHVLDGAVYDLVVLQAISIFQGLTGWSGWSLAWASWCSQSGFGNLELIPNLLQRDFGLPELRRNSSGLSRKAMFYCLHGLSSTKSDEFLSASAQGQAVHTVGSSGRCNFHVLCHYDI